MDKKKTAIDDWRITNQINYLKGINLIFSYYDSAIRDHDHCEFCFAKFSEAQKDLHQGYCSTDKYYWICEKCYSDFKEHFKWGIIK